MQIRIRRKILNALIVLLFLLAWAAPARPASALLSSDPMAIISAVNALRAANGLPPYIVDQGLMSYALEHSRYQASIHNATHTHSDGSTVWQHGMDENIAVGMLGYLTPEYAVYTIWADAIHMKTMIGYPTGYVGAGVADDGESEYYTLDVRPGGGGTVNYPPSGGGTPDPNATPTKIIPIVPLVTVTPRYDRWIIHTVGYGQSLWGVAIAYGVKMEQIRNWNSMAADSTDIYAGQKLYIIAPETIWPTFTPSPVGGPGTAEPTQTVLPGRAITEEPVAATQKAAYQTAEAQAQGGAPGEPALQAAAPAQGASTEEPSADGIQGAAAQVTASQAAPQASPSPLAVQPAQPNSAPPPSNLLLTAGMLILLGGSLLVIFAFSMLRKKA